MSTWKLKKSSSGSALILTIMMVVLLTLEMAIISLISLRGFGEEGILTGQRALAQQAMETEMSQLTRNLYTYLDGGKTHLQAFDPGGTLGAFEQGGTDAMGPTVLQSTNPDGGTLSTGVTLSGWVAERRGSFYHLVVRAQYGGVDTLMHRWVKMNPSFNCSIVESKILAGNIATATNAELIAYAQNNCMIKKGAVPPTYTVNAGTGGACSSTITMGAGAQNYGAFTSGCAATAGTTVGDIRIGAMTSNANHVSLVSTASSARTIDIDTMDSTPSGTAKRVWINATASTAATVFKLNSIDSNTYNGYSGGLNSIWAGSGADTFYINTNMWDGILRGNDGDDTFIIKGLVQIPTCSGWWVVPGSNPATEDRSGIFGGNGNDKIYINDIRLAWCASLMSNAGNDEIYFDSVTTDTSGGQTYSVITGGDGNDIIACTGWMNASCGTVRDAWINGDDADFGSDVEDGTTGNNIISIDSPLTTAADGSGISGGTGSNIVYVKGWTAGAYPVNIDGSYVGASLVIVGGNRSGGAITAAGTNNVLLLKTGTTTSGTTVNGVALGAQTSQGSFSRILWY